MLSNDVENIADWTKEGDQRAINKDSGKYPHNQFTITN